MLSSIICFALALCLYPTRPPCINYTNILISNKAYNIITLCFWVALSQEAHSILRLVQLKGIYHQKSKMTKIVAQHCKHLICVGLIS